MTGLKLSAMIAGALALTGAQQGTPLSQAQPGIWELSGIPGAKAPLKQCLTDVAALAQFEHRGKTCKARVTSSQADSELIEYSCGSAGFGRSEVKVLTPRSLRIDTQGISDQLPFGYVLQARRFGECPAKGSASSH